MIHITQQLTIRLQLLLIIDLGQLQFVQLQYINVNQIADVNERMDLKLFCREIIFEEFQPM